MRQEQFLTVLDRDEAERRFLAAVRPEPLGTDEIPLRLARSRVLAEDLYSGVDVPGFDRSNMDGYAVRAADTFGASEEEPRMLRLNGETLAPGIDPKLVVEPGTATPIATGGIVPRGADAVILVEATDEEGDDLRVYRPLTPGTAITFAGTDIARGELVLQRGEFLTSRETAVLAAIGLDQIKVFRKPVVGILSTGNEIVAPGTELKPGQVYDSNARAIADAVEELGGEPVLLGIVPDNESALEAALEAGLQHDMLLLSGGTSKGPGDVAYRVLEKLPPPGVVAHGVALKPGKPLCLAAAGRKPVAVLPGFPTSALFTFHEFVAPVVMLLSGRRQDRRGSVSATLPVRVHSERGRTEYLLVNLVEGRDGLAAWPMGKGSGSVTTFSKADGFLTIPAHREILKQGSQTRVTLLSRELEPRDLVIIGSHCVGLDLLVARLGRREYSSKILAVGSEAGLRAAQSGQCDLAGIHLLDPKTDSYNEPFLDASVQLQPGYGRMQGVLFRKGDTRFDGELSEAVKAAAEGGAVMVNRNRGSGTRVLIDQLLGEIRPDGHANEARTHNAVAAAVSSGRADFGVAIATVANDYGLGFHPLRAEQYDFVIPVDRADRPAVRAFLEILAEPETRAALRQRGFLLEDHD